MLGLKLNHVSKRGPRGAGIWNIIDQVIKMELIHDDVIQWKHFPLQWRHNEHDSVSNHQHYDCLLNRLFRRRSKETSKLRVIGLCVGNSPGPVNSPHKWPVTRKMFPFDDVIMRGPVNSPHKGQWRGALMFSLICVWINDWVDNREAGDLRRYRAHYDVIVM